MIEATVTDLRWLNEARLMHSLGYVLLCEIQGREYVVNDVREGAGEPNLEVLTLQGWGKPTKCWGVLRQVKVTDDNQVEQGALF